jgi:SAM-dependent methyltransferase
VVEFGSYNINGSIRDWCSCSDYTGVDWIAGPCVDLVSLAHEVLFPPETFDTVLSASMLEHDPYWEWSIGKMIEVMKPDGILAISWGAAKNPPHHFETAPDGKFHALRAGLVLDLLQKFSLYIHEFQYERSICFASGDDEFINIHAKPNPAYGMGEVILVAFKDKMYASGEQMIEPLIDEDKV